MTSRDDHERRKRLGPFAGQDARNSEEAERILAIAPTGGRARKGESPHEVREQLLRLLQRCADIGAPPQEALIQAIARHWAEPSPKRQHPHSEEQEAAAQAIVQSRFHSPSAAHISRQTGIPKQYLGRWSKDPDFRRRIVEIYIESGRMNGLLSEDADSE